jgi:hypothetical protein
MNMEARATSDIKYVPRIMVKFKEDAKLPYEFGVGTLIDKQGLGKWREFAQRFPGARLEPLYVALGPKDLEALIERALSRVKTYRPARFLSWFVIPMPEVRTRDATARALAELSAWPGLELAYLESGPARPPSTDFKKRAKKGIDLDAALKLGTPGARGSGINIIDIEQGWNFEDSTMPPSMGSSPIHGCSKIFFDHGTDVVSIIAGGGRVTGIAPDANVKAASRWHCQWNPNTQAYDSGFCNIPSTHDALEVVLKHLWAHGKQGDIILIESQTQYQFLPEEVQPTVFEQIKLATSCGFVVIEPAGNSGLVQQSGQGVDIDGFISSGPDSGAIIVGAGSDDPQDQHPWVPQTNFGQRVDCFALGEGIDAATTVDFGGTSGAAAIVAGLAACVQGIALDVHGSCYGPEQLRQMLKTNGTPSVSNATNPIGMMPDLAAIVPLIKVTPPV